MTECKTNWSYLAAMFDAEGCFTIANGYTFRKDKGKHHFYSHEVMTIGNTSIPLMKWIVENFGGVSYTTPTKENYHRRQTFYEWRIKGRQNKIAILLGVLPYLIVKREQANVLLQYLRLPNTPNIELRKQFSERIQALNQRGKTPTTNTLDTSVNLVVGENIKVTTTISEVKIESELTGNRESEPDVNQAS